MLEQNEIEVLVGEAESGVERLRSLYDQYFMGIERIEPQIARKDIERRIQVLRRTQIRNTALRFRFQNVLLRYNTFSAHWMRICRQIEEGTYKHHLRKAKDRFDPNTAAREAREARKKLGQLEFGDTEPPAPGSMGYEIDEGVDVDVDFDGGVDAPDVRAALRSYAVPQELVAPSVAGRALGAMKGAGEPARRPAPVEKTTDPAPAMPIPAAAKPPPVPGRSVPPPLPPNRRPPGPPGPPPVPGAARPAPPGAAAAPPVPGRPQPVHAPAPAARPAPAPAAPPAAARPAPAPAPAAARPAPAPAGRPAPAPVAAARPAAKPADPSSVSDERVRQIYSRYVESRRALGESTASLTMDTMAKSLRESSEKLRQKHAGKNVDFEVQVKDGKTVLKPILK